jgi:transketolase
MSIAGQSDQFSLDTRCINTIRTLSIDAIQKANSGHPGAPMGLAPAAYVLWTQVLKHNPENPSWLDRDRFVLSGGHASMLLYSLLYLSGYDLSLDDLKNFRQLNSKTPGHPEFGLTPGVETTTGPLGQGFANAVGMAMAEAHLAARFNREGLPIVDHFTYVMCGDGDMMEGVASEAASLAGHQRLGKLVCIYDDNNISIEGQTDITFTEDVALRFEAYNWHVQRIEDGNDTAAILAALQAAKEHTERPSLIVLRTEIAYGSPNKQGSADAHGAPLGAEEVCLTKECLGCRPDEHFCVPADVLEHFRRTASQGAAREAEWQAMFETYRHRHADLAGQWVDAVTGFIPEGWDAQLPQFKPTDGPIATRAASGQALNACAAKIPTLMGGSADLAPSNKTYLNFCDAYQPGACQERNIRFGVREHAMGAVMNGMYLHHGIRPYGGTFLVFADYMRPAIRLACLMNLSVIYIFTHDSVAVGEDGPTHQPVEQLASLRTIPGLTVIRPADANETVEAWRTAIKTNGPVALVLSRQKLPVIDRALYAPADRLSRGAYIIAPAAGKPDVILIASGAEVHLALEAQGRLARKGVAAGVVNMASWELFEKAPADYREKVLPADVTARIAIEAGHSMGWERYVGPQGAVLGINRFGTSAPGGQVLAHFGFTVENVVEKTLSLLN